MGEAKKEEQARQELIDLGASTTKTARGTIYTLTIIGQIEGHQALPENIKTTNMSTSFPCSQPWRKARKLTGCCCFSTQSAGISRRGLPLRS